VCVCVYAHVFGDIQIYTQYVVEPVIFRYSDTIVKCVCVDSELMMCVFVCK